MHTGPQSHSADSSSTQENAVSVESGADELTKEPVVPVNIKKSAASTENNASYDHVEEPNGSNDVPDEGASTSRMSPSTSKSMDSECTESMSDINATCRANMNERMHNTTQEGEVDEKKKITGAFANVVNDVIEENQKLKNQLESRRLHELEEYEVYFQKYPRHLKENIEQNAALAAVTQHCNTVKDENTALKGKLAKKIDKLTKQREEVVRLNADLDATVMFTKDI